MKSDGDNVMIKVVNDYKRLSEVSGTVISAQKLYYHD